MLVKGECFDDLDAVTRVARGTLDRNGQPVPFDRLGWFSRTWKLTPPGIAPLMIRARSDGADAWLFLARERRDRLVPLSSWYTLAFSPVYSATPDALLKRRLLRAIARRLRAPALGIASVSLSPVPEEEAQALARAFRRAGWLSIVRPATANWRLDVNGRIFSEYWGARPGQLRSTVERKRDDFSIEISDHFDPATWQSYEQVYGESWKPAEGSPAFLREFAEEEGAAGTLRIGIARLGERPVAAQLWTVENGVAIIHKLAHVEDAREHSPGTVLSAAMFERAIDGDGVQTIDFGTGDDAYKADWMEEKRALQRVELFNLARPAAWPRAAKAWLSALVR